MIFPRERTEEKNSREIHEIVFSLDTDRRYVSIRFETRRLSEL